MIGKKIAEIRKERGYTLTELADLTNISKSYLSNIERNLNKNPSLQILLKISNVLNVDLRYLLQGNTDLGTQPFIEKEWAEFVNELKDLGIEKEELIHYKTLIEFIKWKNENAN